MADVSFADRCYRLRFRKVVDKVIPYLPMDPDSNAQVVELKLQQLAATLSGELYTTRGGRECLVDPLLH